MSLYTHSDPYRPSYFELIASDRLLYSLKPAFKFALSRIATYSPLFDRITRYDEEFFHALLLLIENHYLRQFSSTFSENFYGLVRVSINQPNKPKSKTQLFATPRSPAFSYLSRSQRYKALAVLVLVPYVKSRLDRVYSEWRAERAEEEELHLITRFNSLQRFFLLFYPYFHGAWDALSFVYQLRYLFSSFHYFSPFSHSVHQIVRRLSADDIKHFDSLKDAASARDNALHSAWLESRNPALALFQRFRSVFHHFNGLFVDLSKWGVLISIFVYQFLEWYRTAGTAITPSFGLDQEIPLPNERLPIPPPPLSPSPAPDAPVSLHPNKLYCSLCNRLRRNPACSPSGYVFCYPCLFEFVREYQKCPVTNWKCNTEQIRKIYEA
jgi:peroxin-12